MIKDEIIKEVWRAKDAIAAKYKHDATAMAKGLRDREKVLCESCKSSCQPSDYFARRKIVVEASTLPPHGLSTLSFN